MIVFSNTTPFIALSSIDQLGLLPQLFDTEYMKLRVTGTLGILAKAKSAGLIPSFCEAAEAMRKQGLHYSPGLIVRLAQHLGEKTANG